MEFLLLVGVVFGFFAVSLLLMAVGVIIRKKAFKSCACASIEFNGERIQCPACTGEDGKPVGV